MKFTVSRSAPKSFKTDIIVIGCYERPLEEGETKRRPALIKHTDGGIAFDKALGGTLSRQVAIERFTGARNTSRVLFTAGKIPAKFILLVGLGPKEKFELEVLREAGAKIAEAARETRSASAALVLERGPVSEDTAAERARAITEGVILGGYTFDRYKTGAEKDPPSHNLTTFLYQGDAGPVRKEIEAGRIFAEAACRCRDMVNMPGSDLTPTALAKYAKEAAEANASLTCTVMGEEAMRKMKMNGILSVSKGSAEPPVFVLLKYRPKEKARASVALVGKGVTFDAGGISLKPARGMEAMKADMAGAAAVIAAVEAIAELALPVEVTAYIPAAENLPDGRALKPGDVITMKNGKTVEIISTDAEGRLLLADALSYAADEKPDVIIDVATLTGGAVYCCGELYTLVMGTDQKIVDKLKRAAEQAGEPIWQLPIVDAYKKGYTSGIADLNNNGKSKAQTILGAIFLREFVGNVPWAHLDIGASNWTDEGWPTAPRGATGASVRTLVAFVAGFKKTIQD